MREIDLIFAKAEKDALHEPRVRKNQEVPLIDGLKQSEFELMKIEEGDCITTQAEIYRLVRHLFSRYGFSLLLPENLTLYAEKNQTAIYFLNDRIFITVKNLESAHQNDWKRIIEHYLEKMVESGQQAKAIDSMEMPCEGRNINLFSVHLSMPDSTIYKTIGIISCTKRTIMVEFQMNEIDFQAWKPALYSIFTTFNEEVEQ